MSKRNALRALKRQRWAGVRQQVTIIASLEAFMAGDTLEARTALKHRKWVRL